MESLQVETLAETYPGRRTATELIDDLRESLNPERYCVLGNELHQSCVYYAEQTVEPVGWQALWRVSSKDTTSKLELNSPALVEVTNVDYDLLEATVELIDSDDKQQATVPLIELHPLKYQENNAINIEATHLALQKIRFLQNHLMLPWDTDVNENWFELHLPVRVKMYCDLRTGKMSQEVTVRYHFLISEANRVQKELQSIAAKVPDSDDEMEIEEAIVGNIAELNTKLEQIQQDVEILLNPSTRMLLFGSKVTRVSENPEVLLVIQGQSCLAMHQIINKIEREYSSDLIIRCYPSLQTALDDGRVKDTILLPSGIHSLLNINALRQGGLIMGIGSREDVVIHLGCSSEVGLTFDSGCTTLKNCTILVNNKQSGIFVKGKVTLENCIMRGPHLTEEEIGNEAASAWKGFFVTSNSQVVIKQCTIANFDVGIRARVQGQVSISASIIEGCNIGILAEEDAVIEIHDSDFKSCRENAIAVEMESDGTGETMCGGVELLKMLCKKTFQLDDCRFHDNACNIKLEF